MILPSSPYLFRIYHVKNVAAWTARFRISEFGISNVSTKRSPPTEGQYRFLLSRRARCRACTICYWFLSSSAGRMTLGLLLNGERLETTPAGGQTSVNFSGYLAADSTTSCFVAKSRVIRDPVSTSRGSRGCRRKSRVPLVAAEIS